MESSYYYLLKMIQRSNYDGEKNNGKNITAQRLVKRKRRNMCRACLGKATIPILPETNSSTSDILKAILIVANIQIDAQDEYPKFLCHHCYSLLRGAILFRKAAQQSDRILRNMKTASSPDSSDDITEDVTNNTKRAKPLVHKTAKIKLETKKGKSEPMLDLEQIVCPNCNKVVPNYDYSNHMLLHRNPDGRVQCTICEKSMKDERSLKRHMVIVHGKGGSKYICEICGKTCTYSAAYRNHLLSHTDDFPHKCPQCPYRGRNSGLLSVHMRIHTRDFKFTCSDCPARFLTSGNLHKHMLRHKVPKHTCETCNKAFHTKMMLDTHFQVDHLGVKKHVCNICEAAFGYRKAMMKHQLKVHKREKLASGRMPSYLKVEQRNENSTQLQVFHSNEQN